MTTFSKFTIAAVVLASHAAAGPKNFPLLAPGAAVRIFALSGERCVGTVLDWDEVEMTVAMAAPSACGAVDGVLRITPADVKKVDANLHPFRHAVTRPAVWLWTGIEYAVLAPVGIAAAVGIMFAELFGHPFREQP
jgi:hypothetical protein